MRVRSATRADIAAISHIEERAAATGHHPAWSTHDVSVQLANPITLAQVAEHPQHGVVGHVVTTCVVDEGEVLTIAVDPSHQRQGIGLRLLRAAHEAWAEHGVRRAFLEVRDDNVPARALYASLGWTPAGRRTGYYRDGTDAVSMSWEPP